MLKKLKIYYRNEDQWNILYAYDGLGMKCMNAFRTKYEIHGHLSR